MAASDRARVRRVGIVVALVCSTMLVDCSGEFMHSNPFDPAVPVTLRIEGPDKTVAQFDTVRFKVITEPAYDYGTALWSATGALEKLDDKGTFRAPPIGQFTGPRQQLSGQRFSHQVSPAASGQRRADSGQPKQSTISKAVLRASAPPRENSSASRPSSAASPFTSAGSA